MASLATSLTENPWYTLAALQTIPVSMLRQMAIVILLPSLLHTNRARVQYNFRSTNHYQ